MRRLADVASEAAVLAGAGRAILLQIAHPAVGYGVARHSDFATRPMSRLNGTLSYIYALSNGSEEDARLMRRAVNRAHAPVRNPPRDAGTSSVEAQAGNATDGVPARDAEIGLAEAQVGDATDGVPAYDARDPQLQLWVAATLYDTAIGVYERVYGALGDEEGERIYREYAVLGTALQMPAELWPADRAAFRAYWEATVAGLRVDATVRGVADALLRARAAPWWVRAGMPLMRQISVGLLPEAVRREFGFAWSARRQRRVDRLFTLAGPVYRMLPAALRHWPQRYYLARLRAARP